eukprot:3851316-Pyramimonas_sp.AAC.1
MPLRICRMSSRTSSQFSAATPLNSGPRKGAAVVALLRRSLRRSTHRGARPSGPPARRHGRPHWAELRRPGPA